MRISNRIVLVCGLFLISAALVSASAPLVHYTFDGSVADPSQLVVDSSGNGYDAAIVYGSPAGSTDVPDSLSGGNSWDSPGSGDAWLDVDPTLPVPSGNYSIAFWVKPSGSSPRVIATSIPEENGILVWHRTDDYFRYYHNNVQVIEEAQAGVVFSQVDWTHIAVTVDISAGTVTLYVNGVERCSTTGLSLSPLTEGLERIGGRDDGGSTRGYNGKLDDFRLYDSVLTTTEIEALAPPPIAPPPVQTEGVLAHYSFDGSVADVNQIVVDNSTNGYNATVQYSSPVGSTDVPFSLPGGNSWDSPDDTWMDMDVPAPAGNYSIAFWAKPSSDTLAVPITSVPEETGLAVWQRRDFLFRFYHNDQEVITEAMAGAVYSAIDWTHIAVTVDVSAGTVILYVDGVERCRDTGLNLSPLTQGLNRIGARATSTPTAISRAYNGNLDDIRFYDRVITTNELAELDVQKTVYDQDPSRPNILIIATDQQFADVMSCAGTPGLSTPGMDRIAANGVRFTEAYVNYPVCSPQRYAWYTGRLPSGRRKVDANQRPTISLGNQARAAGYNTAYFGKWHVQSSTFEVANEEELPYHGFESFLGGDDRTKTANTVAFLNKPKSKPFLLSVSYMNPHDICEYGRYMHGVNINDPAIIADNDLSAGQGEGPVGPPPPVSERPELPDNHQISNDEADGTAWLRTNGDAQIIGMTFNEEDWRQYRWAYHRLVEMVDAEIVQVLDALESSGLATNTIVIFTSDHGDGYGAHRWHQKSVLYEESIRVPFIVSHPSPTSRKNETDQRLISTGIDLMATVSDIVGVPYPEGHYYGKSMMPFVLDANADAPAHEYVVTECEIDRDRYLGRAVRTANFKYHVYDNGGYREQLFDMVNDRGEMNNLVGNPAYADELQRHRDLLFGDWVPNTDDFFGKEYVSWENWQIVDADNDRLGDLAELTMTGSVVNDSDSDNDGLSDYEEWLVGNDPLGGYNSPFVIPVGTPDNQAYRIEWEALAGRTYTLERSESLQSPDWQPIYSAVGTGGQMTYQDASGTNAFYRLQVR